ncbi:MAG: hypothetical protein JXX29_22925 [Deltaproteobacteria bacterium]|nr:hypothetical protein [Deltaproteobacteria bacterium]MBN2674553.1 hypothetical protein [Deltaproteobacteria bacterium]
MPIVYNYRLSRHTALGAGIMPAYTSIAGVPILGAHFLVSGHIYIVPDWLYAGMQVIGGFPLLAGYDLFLGHAFRIGRKWSLYLENHVTTMIVGGVFLYWQPVVGTTIHF